MKRIRTIGGTIAIALLCAAASAQAQHRGGPPHGGPGRECREQLVSAVGLTDAEQTALTALAGADEDVHLDAGGVRAIHP